MGGIRVLMEETPESSLGTRKRALTRHRLCRAQTLDFSVPRSVRSRVGCSWATPAVVFCCSSLNRLDGTGAYKLPGSTGAWKSYFPFFFLFFLAQMK